MNTTLRVGRRAGRSVSVLAGAALVAGVGLGVVAPGASASDSTEGTDAVGAATVAPSATGSVTTSASASAEPSEEPSVEPSESGSATESSEPTSGPTVTPSASTTVDPSEEPSVEPSETTSATPTVSASAEVSCPGIDDDVDVRTLFAYEYFAAGRDGWVSLGSSPSWTRPLSVQWFSRPVPGDISTMMVRATVTLKDGVEVDASCEYDFSLASYEAEGSTFSTSGQQVFVDHDSATVTAARPSVVLEVDPAECYGQSDLYTSDEVYDGARTPRGPSYSPITADGRMIASWGGGVGCDEPSEEPSGPGTVTPPPSEGPSEGPSEEPSGPGTVTPPPSEGPSEGPSGEPSGPASTPGTPTTTVPVSPGATVTPPVSPGATVSTTPAGATTPAGSVRATDVRTTTQPRAAARVLARTGIETWTVALVAGVLLAAGGAMTVLAGGSRGRRH